MFTIIYNTFLICVLFFVSPERADAYLDPGSMSLWVQALIGGIAGIFATSGLWWQRLKSLFIKNNKGENENEDGKN